MTNLLSDDQWELVEPELTGRKETPGRTGDNNRRTLEGILHVLIQGCSWRALPEKFGKGRSVHKRFMSWTRAGVFSRLFESLPARDYSTIMADGTYVKLQKSAAGARRNGLTPNQSRIVQMIGRSRGGLTTKVFAVVDADGRPICIILAPGNRQEGPMLLDAIEGIDAGEFLGDKAFDSNLIRRELESRGVVAVIPPKANRVDPPPFDQVRYKKRHKVENFFSRIKEFRSIATRYCKLAEVFEANLYLASWAIETR